MATTLTANEMAKDIYLRRMKGKVSEQRSFWYLTAKQGAYLLNLAQRAGQVERRTHGLHVTMPGGANMYTVEVARGGFELDGCELWWWLTPSGQINYSVEGMAHV